MSVNSNLVLQIISNIAAGVHPPNPSGPASVLEYFARTRYSDLIRPEALKEWNGVGNHFGPEIVEGGSPEPSHACWDRVTKRLFHALSAEDLAQVVQGYDNEWAVASDKYKEAMKTMYGGLDTERVMEEISSTLGTVLTALETLTNQRLSVWAGGDDQELSILHVTGDSSTLQHFETFDSLRQTMTDQQGVFLRKVLATSALLSSSLFQQAPAGTLTLEENVPQQTAAVLPVNENAPSSTPPADQANGPLPPGIRVDLPESPKRPRDERSLNASKKVKGVPDVGVSSRRPTLGPRDRSSRLLSSPPAMNPTNPKSPQGAPTVLPPATLTTTHPTTYPPRLKLLIDHLPTSASWLKRDLPKILSVDIGTKYHDLVERLIELETLHGFSNSGRKLSAIGRPTAVRTWTKSGRKDFGEVGDTGVYKEAWWKWWWGLQPEWRKQKKEAPAERNGGGTQPNLTGAWDCLLLPGPNGMLLVVASLYWWGCALFALEGIERGKHEREWTEAVEDCQFALNSMVSVMISKQHRG